MMQSLSQAVHGTARQSSNNSQQYLQQISQYKYHLVILNSLSWYTDIVRTHSLQKPSAAIQKEARPTVTHKRSIPFTQKNSSRLKRMCQCSDGAVRKATLCGDNYQKIILSGNSGKL